MRGIAMSRRQTSLIAAAACAAAALTLYAEKTETKERPPEGQGKRPNIPVIAALDANGDGVVDAAEITNAPVSLRKLDKNHDGKLTRDELMPPRPRFGFGRGEPDNAQPPPDDKQ